MQNNENIDLPNNLIYPPEAGDSREIRPTLYAAHLVIESSVIYLNPDTDDTEPRIPISNIFDDETTEEMDTHAEETSDEDPAIPISSPGLLTKLKQIIPDTIHARRERKWQAEIAHNNRYHEQPPQGEEDWRAKQIGGEGPLSGLPRAGEASDPYNNDGTSRYHPGTNIGIYPLAAKVKQQEEAKLEEQKIKNLKEALNAKAIEENARIERAQAVDKAMTQEILEKKANRIIKRDIKISVGEVNKVIRQTNHTLNTIKHETEQMDNALERAKRAEAAVVENHTDDDTPSKKRIVRTARRIHYM